MSLYKVRASQNPCSSLTRSDPGGMSSDFETDPGEAVSDTEWENRRRRARSDGVKDRPEQTKGRSLAEPQRFMGGGYTLPIVQTHLADDPRFLKIAQFSFVFDLFQRYGLDETKTPFFLPGSISVGQTRTPLFNTRVTFNIGPSSLPLDNGYSWVNFEGAWMLISKVKDETDTGVTKYTMHSWMNYAPLITVIIEVIPRKGGLPNREKIVLTNFYYSYKASTNEVNLWSLFFAPRKLGVSLISKSDVEAIRAGKSLGSPESEAEAEVLFRAFAHVLFEDADDLLTSRLRLSIPKLVRLAVDLACPPSLLEDRYVQMVVLTEYLRRMQRNPRYGAMKKFLRTKRGFKFLRFIQTDCATEKVLCRAATATWGKSPVGPWAEKKLANILELGNDNPTAPEKYVGQMARMEIVSLIEVETDLSKTFRKNESTIREKMSRETAEYKINGMFKQMKNDPGYGLDTSSLALTYGTVVEFFRDYWRFLRSEFAGLSPALLDSIAEKVQDLELMRLSADDFGLGPDPVETLRKGGLYRLMGPAVMSKPVYLATLATAGSFFNWTSAGGSK